MEESHVARVPSGFGLQWRKQVSGLPSIIHSALNLQMKTKTTQLLANTGIEVIIRIIQFAH